MTTNFSYDELTTRNIGFISADQQERLRASCVFICGVGGMGGAALMSLARAGVGHFIIADLDRFEVSNLNRQVFANLDTVDELKTEAARDQISRINPDATVEVFDHEWSASVDDIMGRASVVVNGTDDLAASLLLYRKARELGLPVIDAYASPLPSVYVTRAGEKTPEDRLNYPTIDTNWDQVNDEQRAAAFQEEAIHVLVHSTSRHYIDLDAAGEVAAGRRSRMSFAPMVITTGNLMAYEAIAFLLGEKSGTDNRGWFFNPYRPALERPKPELVAAVLRPIIRRFLNKMMQAS